MPVSTEVDPPTSSDAHIADEVLETACAAESEPAESKGGTTLKLVWHCVPPRLNNFYLPNLRKSVFHLCLHYAKFIGQQTVVQD